jgi:hypothetical protein
MSLVAEEFRSMRSVSPQPQPILDYGTIAPELPQPDVTSATKDTQHHEHKYEPMLMFETLVAFIGE